MLFLLRNGYVHTASLLLDELSSAPATDGGRVMEAVLRGVVGFRMGNATLAKQQFARAWQLVDRISDADVRAEATRAALLAESGCGLGTRHTLADIDHLAAITQQEETSLWLPRVLTERGIEHEARNDPRRAEEDFLRAMSILERREPRIDQSALLLGASVARESPFDRLIRLYLAQQQITAALHVAQRSTSLRISSLHARGMGVPDVFRAHGGSPGEPLEDFRRTLPDRHVAIAQHLLSDSLITWIVTATSVRAVRRNISAEELIRAVTAFHRCASRDGCREGPELERVSDLLLRDWIEHVPRGATVWLQRPAELQAVPFTMLKTRGGERLLFRNPLTNAPGFAVFARAQHIDEMRRGDLTAFFAAAPQPPGALESLPMAAREVTRASRFYDKARVEVAALRRMFADSAGSYTIAHFAGHVLVNDDRPLFSAMAFNDGLLYIHELDRRSFSRVRLVVLSGCDSGRTPKPAMSVANALMSQDVPSVVYTLWAVEDAIAAEFSIHFHHAIADGKSRAESLQYASSAIWKRYPDRPSAWAAFQLAGAPGAITTQAQGEIAWNHQAQPARRMR